MKKYIIIFIFLLTFTLKSEWQLYSNNLPSAFALSIASKDSNVYIGLNGQGFYKSTDNGYTWINKTGILSVMSIKSIIFHNNKMFVGISQYGVYSSTNDGTNWVANNNGLKSQIVNALLSEGIYIIAGTENGIYISTNDGLNWVEKNEGLTNLAISGLTKINEMIYASTKGGGIFYWDINQTKWIEKNNGLKDLDIKLISSNYNSIFAASGNNSNKLYVSIDFGETWIDISNRLPAYQTFTAISTKERNIFVGAYEHFFHSTDNGLTWNEKIQGLNKSIIFSLGYNDEFLFAGTYFTGMYRSPFTSLKLSDVYDDNNLEPKISPNPASDYIEISLSPAGGGRGWTDSPSIKRGQGGVLFEIFNIFGEKIPPRQTSSANPQEGNLKIDISNLPAGVYFIKIGDKFEKFIKNN